VLRRFPVIAARLRRRSRCHTQLVHDHSGARSSVDGVDYFLTGHDLLGGIQQVSLVHPEDHGLRLVDLLHGIMRSVEPCADFGRKRIEVCQIGGRSAELVKFASHDIPRCL
jgi:hypothetical protein